MATYLKFWVNHFICIFQHTRLQDVEDPKGSLKALKKDT